MQHLIFLQTGDPSWSSISFIVFLITIAICAIVLYRRYLSRRELMQRVQQLEALSEAGGALVASVLDVEALCELIYEQTSKLIDTHTFQVGLFQENFYHILVWIIEGKRQEPEKFDLSKNAGVVGWVRDHKQPLLVHDFLKEIEKLPARPRYISHYPPRSAIFIPLVSGENVIGILAAQSPEPYRFDEGDQQLLMIIANQAASAITNATLYKREQTRARQMAVVNEIAQAVNASRDLNQIFRRVVRLTREQFHFHHVNIFGYDEAIQQLVIRASSEEKVTPNTIRLKPRQGIVGLAFSDQQSIILNDVKQDKRYLAGIDSAELAKIVKGTQSEMAIPLIVDGKSLGVLDIHSPYLAAFSNQEQMALEALAAQVAIAIHQKRQTNRQQKHAWLTTAQLQVANAIRCSEELDSLLEQLTRLTTILTGCKDCLVLLWDSELERYTVNGFYFQESTPHPNLTTMQLRLGDWYALDAVHVGHEILTTQVTPPWQSHWQQSTLYPLIAKDALLGVMVVSPPTDQEIQQELLHNISIQTAQAVSSLLLDIAQQEEAWVNTVLLQVAEAVNSLTNLEDILSTVVRFVPMLVGVRFCIALVYDKELESFHVGTSYGLSEMGRGLLESFEIPQQEIPIIAEREEGLFKPEPTYYELALPPWLQKVFGTRTANAFPLHARSQLVGSLVIGESTTDRPLAGRRLNILAGIAHQAAIALVNDQLYHEAAEREKLTRELQVAHEIQASLIPNGSPNIPGCQVASSWQAAHEVSGDFYDFIPLADGRWGIVVADVADKGMPAAIFMAVSRTILRTVAYNRQSPSQALMRANDLILNDTHSDLFVTIFYAIWDPAQETLTYASGGHNPALLLTAQGQQKLLPNSGMALGVLSPIVVEEETIPFQLNDTIVIYTDGVTEAVNEAFDEYTLDRLWVVLKKNVKKDAHTIAGKIVKSVQNHAGDSDQFDDITLVVLKRQ